MLGRPAAIYCPQPEHPDQNKPAHTESVSPWIEAKLAGREDVELHFERFAAPPVVDGREFSVCIPSTGNVVDVGAQETLLSALQRSGVSASYSCQQGFCGTCRTRVLDGDVDHRDTLLTDPERNAGTMLVCVSRAPEGERLTLDL